MDTRQLGRSALRIAPFMLGGNVFGWTADAAMSFRLLDQFVEAGFNAIDTADAYSAWIPGHAGGESETVIGQWLAQGGRRDKVVIATKVGMWARHSGLRRDNILAAAEDSLKRLQTDYIDLYQAHMDDANTPIEETLAAFDSLVRAGKARVIGASNFTAARLSDSLAASAARGQARYESLQPHYNLVERGFETDLQPLCLREQIGVIPYFSLAAGFLTGKYRKAEDLKQSARGAGVEKYLTPHGLGVLAALDAVAARQAATPAQVALAWLITRPAVTAAIASATSPAQLGELIKGFNLILTAEDVAELDKASA